MGQTDVSAPYILYTLNFTLYTRGGQTPPLRLPATYRCSYCRTLFDNTSYSRAGRPRPYSCLRVIAARIIEPYLTTRAVRDPQGTTDAVLPATSRCSYCLINRKGLSSTSLFCLFPQVTPLAAVAGCKLTTFGGVNLFISYLKRCGKHLLCLNLYLCCKR